nr:bifunctional diguanylate cyclase/phosphodiesterase [Neiella litorisoli]
MTLEHKLACDEVSELNNAYVQLLNDVHHLATNDSLTGLANRYSFHLWLERQAQRAAKTGEKMALLFIDLDNFKRVNDNYGHATGDRLLQTFSAKLISSIRPSDVAVSMRQHALARLAGDEFAVLLTQVNNSQSAEIVAKRILKLFDNGLEVDGVSYNVQASIGIAMMPEDGTHSQDILKHADAAMYKAKALGKNRYQFCTEDIARALDLRNQIEQALEQALDHNGFHLVFMPIYDLTIMQPTGAEVLIRCPALAEMGISPEQFIPIAEATGQIKRIDLWVLERALQILQEMNAVPAFEHFYLAINISAVELHNKQFTRQVSELLSKYQTNPAQLELELTETSLANDDPDSLHTLTQLTELGLTLSLDDFGTGYTAFTQLASYPVSALKIDRSFTAVIGDRSATKQPMVDIILSLAKLYQLDVVAEGVESQQQLDYLQQRGCHRAQGYFLCQPIDKDALLQTLSTTA